MATVKTAISIDHDLHIQITRLAKRLRVPRSRLYARAVRGFLAQQHEQDLAQALERAYSVEESPRERRTRSAATAAFRRLVEGTW